MNKAPLSVIHPELAKEWHPTKNGKLKPEEVSLGSDKIVWWKCEQGEDHEWKARIYTRTNGVGCSVCAGKTIVVSNCLATTHPELAEQWDYENNGQLTPFNINAGSNKKVWWKCDNNPDHKWKAVVGSRKKGFGCPYCHLTPQSIQELIILFELKLIFRIISTKGFKKEINGRIESVDIFIKELSLGIEFDGSYWHKGNIERDIKKTQKLISSGIEIIRIRQQPLEALFSNDIISKAPFNGKIVVNSLLLKIQSLFKLDNEIKTRIENYLSQGELLNQKALEVYIDRILKKKSYSK